MLSRLASLPIVLVLLVLLGANAYAQEAPTTQSATSQAATSRPATRPAVSVAEAWREARAWVAAPARTEPRPGFQAGDIEYRQYTKPRPLRLWIARIDTSNPDVRFVVTEPATFTGDDAQFETRCATTLEFARQTDVQLAINTSAFAPFRGQSGQPMDVVGLAAVAGRVYSPTAPKRAAMYIAEDGRIALRAPPLDDDGVWHVVPGFALVLDDGRCAVPKRVANSGFGQLHPRTAVGVDRTGRTLWIVVADGRQPDASMGLTLVELAALFDALGAWDALNLDGGGSSTLVVQSAAGTHAVVNTPVGAKAPGTLRQVANNLGVRLERK